MMANQRVFISDCEGPISRNDNAFELTSHFVPDGDALFALLSKYDDVLADVIKRPGYRAGYTLKLILPFLKAYGATNKGMKEYSSRHILLVPGAQDTLNFVNRIMSSFIISTSYEQYISSLCDLTEFPRDQTCCTQLDLDRYELNGKEQERLGEIRAEISAMPLIEIPENGQSIEDFSAHDQKTIRRLDEIFWQEIRTMKSGVLLREVHPVGDGEKADAISEIANKLDSSLKDIMYVGDSITDVSSLQRVRQNGGLAVSFNGNEYAIREAELAVLSGNTTITSVIAETFNRLGKDAVIKLVEEGTHFDPKKYHGDSTLKNHLLTLYPKALPQVEIITPTNQERLMRESSTFRKKVRGEAIGRLG
jgi:energy-converting hydrogenase A subunit R